MRRVVIFGCSGSGKSTFALKLGTLTGLPVVHIDKLFWRPGWVRTPNAHYLAALQAHVEEDAWIIEGANLATFPMRLPRADTLIWFQRGRWLCLWRALKRIATGYGRTRPDMAEGCPEKLDWDFLKFIWNFETAYRARADELIAMHGRHLRLTAIRSDSDADRVLAAAGR